MVSTDKSYTTMESYHGIIVIYNSAGEMSGCAHPAIPMWHQSARLFTERDSQARSRQ